MFFQNVSIKGLRDESSKKRNSCDYHHDVMNVRTTTSTVAHASPLIMGLIPTFIITPRRCGSVSESIGITFCVGGDNVSS